MTVKYNTGVPYPLKNSTIVLREPFPKREWTGSQLKYYIRATVNDTPEQEIRIVKKQQIEIMDYLILVDKKLTNAIIRCDSYGRFVVERHSPASDFFYLVDKIAPDLEEKCIQ